MTNEQKNKYEEVSRDKFPDEIGEGRLLQRACFIEGCKHAHSEGKKEGWNEAIELSISTLKAYKWAFDTAIGLKAVLDELQKLRK